MFRMGLAISFVSTVPEKVWYHTCPSKGKNCHNTKLVEQGGCCKWYMEMTYLADIEEHLGRSHLCMRCSTNVFYRYNQQ
jgi:ATP-dependent RNA helicase DDX1